MPVVPMREILDRAFAERYGVAAINVVDDLTLEAVLAAATELEAPLIVQTSLKTVKSLGARPFYAIWRARADEVPVPVTLHLDHCPDREWITTLPGDGLELGAVRRLRARRRREHAPDDRGGRRGRPPRRPGRGRDRERDRRGGRDRLRARRRGPPRRGLGGVHRRHRGVLVRAGDRDRARALQGRAAPDAGARLRDRRAASDPDGPARRHGPDRGAVRRPHRARLRQGQHLDGAEDRVRRRASRVPRREPGQARPAVAAAPRARGGQGRWRSATSGSSARRVRRRRSTPRPPDRRARADLRLRRRARRHRARRPPAGVQPGVRRGGPAVRPGRRRSTASGSRSAAARSGSRRCSPTRTPQAERIAALHKRKTAIYKEIVRAGRLPGRPGVARVVDEALAAGWTLAVASTSAEESVRAVLEHVVGAETAARFAVFAGDVVPAKKPDPGIYLLALDELGVAPADAIVVEDSRNGLLAAVGAGLRCVVTLSSYTGDEDMREARARRHEPRRPRRARARRRQPQRRAAGRSGDDRRPRGVPDRTPAR